ncbi:MAG: hypothetical protein QM756_30235 [Polyangiaceae bacterium]
MAVACLIIAVAVALACAVAMFRRARRLSRVELPSAVRLVESARERAGSDAENARLLAELDELLIDVDGDSRALPEVASALGRVSLASGTGLALLSLASNFGFAALPSAAACFAAGVVGATAVSYFGRLASARSRAIRAHWSDVIVKARRQIDGAQREDLPSRFAALR